MKNLQSVALAVGLILASAAAAQAQQAVSVPPGAEQDPLSSNCTYNFGSGAFVWCVSESGSVMRLTSPAGYEHIRNGDFLEGYVVCAPGLGPYYETGEYGSSGWGAPVRVSGPSGTGVTIRRTTSDGRFTLLQAFKGDKTERDITITMTLTNNGGAIGDVQLLRSADFDVDGNHGSFFNEWDNSADGVWARELHAVTASANTLTVYHEVGGTDELGPVDCTPPFSLGQVANRDLASVINYFIGGLNAGAKKVVKVVYRVQ